MVWTDVINGSLEVVAGGFVYLSVRRLLKDKQVHGLSWVQLVFFTVWGFWNLPFYYALEQWLSFVGAIGVAAVNAWYLVLVLKYDQTLEPFRRTALCRIGRHKIVWSFANRQHYCRNCGKEF